MHILAFDGSIIRLLKKNIETMIKTIIRLGLLLLVGVLVYNYFLGTQEEKESSERIFNEVKDLGQATWSLLKSEKEKFDQGKYDEALSKIDDIFEKIKGEASKDNNEEALQEVRDLQFQQEKLKDRIATTDMESEAPEATKEKEAISDEWQRILQKTEEVMKKVEKQE
jgi:ElaB/YqjD/DUF883 family membrane-anchored ribosome-binding protein